MVQQPATSGIIFSVVKKEESEANQKLCGIADRKKQAFSGTIIDTTQWPGPRCPVVTTDTVLWNMVDDKITLCVFDTTSTSTDWMTVHFYHHFELSRVRFGCKLYVVKYSRGNFRVENRSFSLVWNKHSPMLLKKFPIPGKVCRLTNWPSQE